MRYDLAHPGRIFGIAAGAECKILIARLESEWHPDLAIYKTPPMADDDGVWATWIPEIVVEIVSRSSAERDYGEKREEYLQFGILKYWILDAQRREMLILRRTRGRWAERVVRPPDLYRTKLLPGFEFSCGDVFDAAGTLRD
jgi:Uma2 family endonuclease